jgi:hypothetical protein
VTIAEPSTCSQGDTPRRRPCRARITYPLVGLIADRPLRANAERHHHPRSNADIPVAQRNGAESSIYLGISRSAATRSALPGSAKCHSQVIELRPHVTTTTVVGRSGTPRAPLSVRHRSVGPEASHRRGSGRRWTTGREKPSGRGSGDNRRIALCESPAVPAGGQLGSSAGCAPAEPAPLRGRYYTGSITHPCGLPVPPRKIKSHTASDRLLWLTRRPAGGYLGPDDSGNSYDFPPPLRVIAHRHDVWSSGGAGRTNGAATWPNGDLERPVQADSVSPLPPPRHTRARPDHPYGQESRVGAINMINFRALVAPPGPVRAT